VTRLTGRWCSRWAAVALLLTVASVAIAAAAAAGALQCSQGVQKHTHSGSVQLQYCSSVLCGSMVVSEC
jgi:hypothetical protein